MQYGIPELYIPPLEPLMIPQIKMDQDTGAVYVHSTYRNIHIYGLSNFTIKSLSIDGNKMKFVSTLKFPNITMTADYEIDGKIMMMPLSGNGECTANFSKFCNQTFRSFKLIYFFCLADVELQTVLLGERLKKDGRVYLRIKNIALNYNVGKVKLDLKNLFNGDDSMGDRMNKFLNENWDSLSEELRPLLEKSLTEVVKTSTDKLLKAYSYDDLLPE